MNASEWIWTKIGFGLIGVLSGVIWGLFFLPFISILDSDVSAMSTLKVFAGSFLIISLINERLIGKAGLSAIYVLFGMVYGFFATGGAVPSNLTWSEHGKELAVCFLAGMASMLLVLLA